MKNRMKTFVSMLVLVVCSVTGWVIFGQSLEPRLPAVEQAARDAVSADDDVARKARAQLRAMGPGGLEALFSVHAADVAALLKGLPAYAEMPASWARVRGALDAVARQRDAHASRLFWYTDMRAARNAAREQHRPILSLRLLGNLDDEMSCANSRYFRTALYANRAISDRLRAGWILHWDSVRPAPHMTIDFGDGRCIERTVTGNSLHYVLDEDERVLDVLPGLMGPGMFFHEIAAGEELARQAGALQGADRVRRIAAFHRDRILDVERSWAAELRQLGVSVEDVDVAAVRSRGDASDAAIAATARLAMLSRLSDPDRWQSLGERHAADAALDADSIALMRLKTRGVYSDASFGRVLEKFEAAAAVDGIRNLYLLRPAIDGWFADENAPMPDLAALTEKIYDRIFLTPRRDPWLGLVPAETYSAIEGDGRQLAEAKAGRHSIDGVAIPTDEEILKLGPPPTAVDASIRAGMKTLLELPSVQEIVLDDREPRGDAPTAHAAAAPPRG